jgi:hypothetical protein
MTASAPTYALIRRRSALSSENKMIYPKPKYLDSYTFTKLSLSAFVLFVLTSAGVNLTLFSIYNSSLNRPGTVGEIVDYIAVTLSSAIASLIAVVLIHKTRDMSAESIPSIIPVAVVGTGLFIIFFCLYALIIGLG